jgi:hypothetical protein
MKSMLDKILAGARPSWESLRDSFGEAVPVLHDLEKTHQDPGWHAEGNVAIHSKMVLDALYEELERDTSKLEADTGQLEADTCRISVEDQKNLILSALFHDLAKPWTTRTSEPTASCLHGTKPGVALS